MFKFETSIFRHSGSRCNPTTGGPLEIRRRLRSFDANVLSPYDDMGLVAYLKNTRLKGLTSQEIIIYLLLFDQTETQWNFADGIATALHMNPERVLKRLARMKRKGYLMHKPFDEGIDNPAHGPIWICDPAHVCANPEYLFADFALI